MAMHGEGTSCTCSFLSHLSSYSYYNSVWHLPGAPCHWSIPQILNWSSESAQLHWKDHFLNTVRWNRWWLYKERESKIYDDRIQTPQVGTFSKNAIQTNICNLLIHSNLYLTDKMTKKRKLKIDACNTLKTKSWDRGMFTTGSHHLFF